MCDTHDVPLDQNGNPSGCKCWRAVMQAYATLTAYNNSDRMAMDAAIRVYRFHHPEDSKEDCRLIVERWVYKAVHHAGGYH